MGWARILRLGARYHISPAGIEPLLAERWRPSPLLGAITAYSALRAVLEILWVPFFDDWTWYVSLAHNYPLYGLLLALCPPVLIDRVLCKLGGSPDEPERLRQLVQVMVVLWAVIYPLVPAVSMLTGSPFLRHVELFRHVPGFLVRENFLPSGMLVAVVLLLWQLPLAVRRIYGCGRGHAWASVLGALALIYLLFYQWGLHLLYALFAWDRRLGHVPFFIAYSASFLVLLAACAPRLRRAYPEVSGRAFALALGMPLAALALAPEVGLLAAARVKGWL